MMIFSDEKVQNCGRNDGGDARAEQKRDPVAPQESRSGRPHCLRVPRRAARIGPAAIPAD